LKALRAISSVPLDACLRDLLALALGDLGLEVKQLIVLAGLLTPETVLVWRLMANY
jgi:hypothetical protein